MNQIITDLYRDVLAYLGGITVPASAPPLFSYHGPQQPQQARRQGNLSARVHHTAPQAIRNGWDAAMNAIDNFNAYAIANGLCRLDGDWMIPNHDVADPRYLRLKDFQEFNVDNLIKQIHDEIQTGGQLKG